MVWCGVWWCVVYGVVVVLSGGRSARSDALEVSRVSSESAAEGDAWPWERR